MSHSIIFNLNKKNNQQIMFNTGVELGKFLGCINVLPDAYQAISEMTFPYELQTSRSGYKILSFKCCSTEYTTRFLKGEFRLISSQKLQVIDFISTKINASISINEAAVELFQHLGDDLKELENEYINTSLIITGSGLGGYLAILYTLRMHQGIDEREQYTFKNIKRPICMTFGSPIIGDEVLQRVIAERPHWKSSFLNVVTKKDPVASFFSSNTPYKPFGTFLFCTESGGHTAFEDPDSILSVLDAMKLWNACNYQFYDYMNILSSIRRKVLCRGMSKSDEFNLNLLRVGIKIQLKEAGVLNDIMNDDIEKMEMTQMNMIETKNVVKAYVDTKKLADVKISLTYMEWYMKSTKTKGGYYDDYKNSKTRDEMHHHQQIEKHHHSLNAFWKKIVEDMNRMVQKQGDKLRKLFGANNYRKIIEPLDIAEHYKRGKENYIKYRPNHYKLIDKWLDQNIKNSRSSEGKRNKAVSLTEDSCFWAHVEEALISLKDLVNGRSVEEQKLEEFEAYVMELINNYSVSPEIFLKGSSFMKLWNEYKASKGTSYASEFAQYMNNKRYESYQ